MVTKCANRSCPTVFKYFNEGRLYRFPRIPGDTGAAPANVTPDTEWFWLCGRCALQMTLVLDARKGVTPRALREFAA